MLGAPLSSGASSGGHAQGAGDLRIGGMALANGLLLHSPRFWAAAVRDGDGKVKVASGRKRARLARADEGGWPVVRGLARLADALAVLPTVKFRLGAAVLPFEDPRLLAALALSGLATFGVRRGGRPTVGRELAAVGLGLAPVLAALRGSPTAGYHGAEHKSIGEHERAVRGEPPAGATREHDRCGSNLVGPLIATNVAGHVALRRITRRPGPLTMLAGAMLSTGLAFELFRWMSRHPGSKVAAGLSQPGRLLQQFFTTREPSPDQMEVARAALAEILRLESGSEPTG